MASLIDSTVTNQKSNDSRELALTSPASPEHDATVKPSATSCDSFPVEVEAAAPVIEHAAHASSATAKSLTSTHLPSPSQISSGVRFDSSNLTNTNEVPILDLENIGETCPHLPVETPTPFVPSLGAWAKRISIIPELKDPIPHDPPTAKSPRSRDNVHLASDILPPEVKEDGQLRFPWAAKMDPKNRNLFRTTTPTYLEDGTPMVAIPNHVLRQGLANQREYVIGQFYHCNTPSGGLVHAIANRIWGKKCKIFTRKLGESSFLFHIPDESTRAWVLERKLWRVDECIMFVGPWTTSSSLALPEITSIPLWVTLKNIPSCLYSDWGISWIASGLGEPMLTNKPRLDPTMIGEAKLMVEVELDKPLPQRIAAGDEQGNLSMVSVEYSWIPTKCERCGKLGHKVSRCLQPDQGFSLPPAPIVVNVPVVVQDMASQETSTTTSNPIVSTSARDTSLNVADTSITTITTTVPPLATDTEVVPATPIASSPDFATTTTALLHANTTPSSGLLPASATVPTPPQSDSLVYEDVQRNVFGGNQFASLDLGVYTEFDVGDFSLTSRGGRPLKPTQKVQEMQWSLVGGRGKKGQRGRGGRGPPA